MSLVIEPVLTSKIEGVGIVGAIDMLNETAVPPEQEYPRDIDLAQLKFTGHEENSEDGA